MACTKWSEKGQNGQSLNNWLFISLLFITDCHQFYWYCTAIKKRKLGFYSSLQFTDSTLLVSKVRPALEMWPENEIMKCSQPCKINIRNAVRSTFETKCSPHTNTSMGRSVKHRKICEFHRKSRKWSIGSGKFSNCTPLKRPVVKHFLCPRSLSQVAYRIWDIVDHLVSWQ